MFNAIKKIFKKNSGPTVRKITPFMGEYLSKVGQVRPFRDGYTVMENEKKEKLYHQDIAESVQKQIRREDKLKQKQNGEQPNTTNL